MVLAVQSPTAFDMMPYILGQKGPAQCVDLSDGPLRLNLVPRDGGEPLVSPRLSQALDVWSGTDQHDLKC